MDGTYACVDSSPSTWSRTTASRGRGFCIVYVVAAMPRPASKPAGYKCTVRRTTLLNDSNVFGVGNGGTPPSFSTRGATYCVTQLTTYLPLEHGRGKAPGSIGPRVLSGLGGAAGTTLGPFKATGSAGQGGAPNVNWTVSPPTWGRAMVIDGTYACVDSSADVVAEPAERRSRLLSGVRRARYPHVRVDGGNTHKQQQQKKKETTSKKPKAKCKKGKLGIAAAPDTGKPPPTVTFALCSPKTVRWRIDFGDGASKVGNRIPPPSITHTYKIQGDFRPTLTVLASTTSYATSLASTSSSVHIRQLISLTANPASGNAPLRVGFGLSTTASSITGWSLDYGGGTRTTGTGRPPASLAHTYSAAGSYKATFSVKVGQSTLIAALALVTVGGGAPPVLGLTASPTSGPHPLHVTFSITVNIPGRIVSWQLRFGDGQTAAVRGRPPGRVGHTLARRGTYAAYLLVTQQQQYAGVLYVTPRSAQAISAG